MNIKMKLIDVLDINKALQIIIEDKNIDSLIKFRFLGIMKALENQVSSFDIIRNEKIKEFGKEAEDGTVSINEKDKESMENFANSLKEILCSEVSVNIDKIKAKDIFNKGISTENLVKLYKIIEE